MQNSVELREQSPVLGMVDSHLRVQGCDAVQHYEVQLTFTAIAQMLVQRFLIVLGKQLPILGVVGHPLRCMFI